MPDKVFMLLTRVPAVRHWRALQRRTCTARALSCTAAGREPAAAGQQASPNSNVALVDASSYMYRFHHAFRNAPLTAFDGTDTTIHHNMTQFVLRLVAGTEASLWGPATSLVVAFDGGADRTRLALYPDYKANRAETPAEVTRAMLDMPPLLHNFGVCTVRIDGTEADDVIGTLATQLVAAGKRVTIFSIDKDFKQLLSPSICMYSKNKTETEGDFRTAYGFEPRFFVDFLALKGDQSDNVPGVPKIGEKRALQLVQSYQTIENMYDCLGGMPEGLVKRALTACGREHALLMKELVKLNLNVSMPDGARLIDSLPRIHHGPGPDILQPSTTGLQEGCQMADQLGLNKILGQLRDIFEMQTVRQ